MFDINKKIELFVVQYVLLPVSCRDTLNKCLSKDAKFGGIGSGRNDSTKISSTCNSNSCAN